MDQTYTRRGLIGLGLALSLGCTSSPNRGDPTIVEENGLLRQSGMAEVFSTADGIQIVYPRPFAEVPRLTLGVGKGSVAASEVELVEQRPDHFTVRWKRDGGIAPIGWSAEGKPASPRGER